jgi:hypothetical protein
VQFDMMSIDLLDDERDHIDLLDDERDQNTWNTNQDQN